MVSRSLLILRMRAARRRARVAAEAEVVGLLRGLEPRLLTGGPFGDRGGLIWIEAPEQELDLVVERLPRLGYCDAVDLLEPVERALDSRSIGSSQEAVRWRGADYRVLRLYEEDSALMRRRAPDRRPFLMETPAGIRSVVGYRGDGGPFSRRGLPVADARLLVNLVFSPSGGRFLDPFAGIGGVAIEAKDAGWRVLTGDIDPTLRHGLTALGAAHFVADASRLPLPDQSVQAIATEPPYHVEADIAVRRGFREMARVLGVGGRLAILASERQRAVLVEEAHGLDLTREIDCPIDRKGLDVVLMGWIKNGFCRATGR